MTSFRFSRSGSLLVLLLVVFLSLRSLSNSQHHLFPTNDEISYLSQARSIHTAGLFSTVKSHFRGEYRNADRNPLYMMMISPLMDNTPRDFTRAKLASLVQMIVLILAVAWLCARQWGELVGLGATLLIALSPLAAHLSQRLLADILFTGAFFVALMMFVAPSPNSRRWALAGALAGVAYLTKDNGHMLLAVPLVIELTMYRDNFYKRFRTLSAILTFFAVSSFLLVRNLRVGGTLFYNSINHVFWIDDWREFYLFPSQGIWDTIGARWYFAHHTLADVVTRVWYGFSNTVMMLIVSCGIGFDNYYWKFFTGLGLLVLAGLGLKQQWSKGERQPVIGALTVVLLMSAGSTWIMLPSGINFRLMFPVLVLLTPFMILSLKPVARYLRAVFFAITMFAIGVLSTQGLPLRENPLQWWRVPPFWNELSIWVRGHLSGEPFLVNCASTYSMWDYNGPDTHVSFPYNLPTSFIFDHLQKNQIRYALIDQSVTVTDPFVEKYGPSDAWGPVTFLGWNRCFHDSLQPSVLLLYGAPCSPDKSEAAVAN